MKSIFIINGTGRSGKDTFVEVARMWSMTNRTEGTLIPIYNVSSVDKVKEAAKLLGWNEEKDEKGRKFLSDLKYMSSELYNGPFRYMANFVIDRSTGIFFLHIREPVEIVRWVKEFPQTKTILIKRDTIEKPNNRADQEVELYDYDFVIDNNGTLEEYVKKIAEWCKMNF